MKIAIGAETLAPGTKHDAVRYRDKTSTPADTASDQEESSPAAPIALLWFLTSPRQSGAV